MKSSSTCSLFGNVLNGRPSALRPRADFPQHVPRLSKICLHPWGGRPSYCGYEVVCRGFRDEKTSASSHFGGVLSGRPSALRAQGRFSLARPYVLHPLGEAVRGLVGTKRCEGGSGMNEYPQARIWEVLWMGDLWPSGPGSIFLSTPLCFSIPGGSRPSFCGYEAA